MKILVIGDLIHFQECRQKLGEHVYTHLTSHPGAEMMMAQHEAIFDYTLHKTPGYLEFYSVKDAIVFVNCCAISLAALTAGTSRSAGCTFFGFNGLPTMFNREFLEVSVLHPADLTVLKNICTRLNTAFLQVDDRAGLVTPRVICMIINEAYYTVQEGTASREDIDLAMKLGTNYPYGPFEWCEKIGLKNVYEVLESIYEDTKDERYKISALMRKEYLGVLGIRH